MYEVLTFLYLISVALPGNRGFIENEVSFTRILPHPAQDNTHTHARSETQAHDE